MWSFPPISGPPAVRRGYHSAAASKDGSRLFLFGGLDSSEVACDALEVLDLSTWTLSRPETTGAAPSPRFGHSSVCYRGYLWVFGGGNGSDLLRSGEDLGSAFRLNLSTWVWERLVPTDPALVGKCHSAVQLGGRMLFFGGSMTTSRYLVCFDMDNCRWFGVRSIQGAAPAARLSATATLLESRGAGGDPQYEVLVFGGYTYEGEAGDLHRLRLAAGPGQAEGGDARRRPEESAQRAARPRRGGPTPEGHVPGG